MTQEESWLKRYNEVMDFIGGRGYRSVTSGFTDEACRTMREQSQSALNP